MWETLLVVFAPLCRSRDKGVVPVPLVYAALEGPLCRHCWKIEALMASKAVPFREILFVGCGVSNFIIGSHSEKSGDLRR